MEAISGLWQTDESSQKIVTEMTDYHVRLDSVYAPEILECTEKRLIFAGSFGLVIYDRQSERVSATIDLQKIESNHFNADTLQTRFLIQGDELVIYNLQNKKYMERAITIIFQRMVKRNVVSFAGNYAKSGCFFRERMAETE